LVSEVWLASKWCGDEYQLANRLNKKLFALLIDDIPLDRLPGGLTAQWQVVQLKGEPAERFLTVHPRTQRQSPVHIAEVALKSLKRGLAKAGIGPKPSSLSRMRAARSAGARLIGGSRRSSRRMQPSSSDAAPISCEASTRCAGWGRESRRACLSFSARRVPANLRFCVRGFGRGWTETMLNGCRFARVVLAP